MKKITLLCFTLFSFIGFAQQKSTGVVNLTSNMTAVLLLDNGTSTVTLTLSGPNDRYIALQFGSFEIGMEAGTDLVYWNNTTLVDAKQNGIGSSPTSDSVNNWTLVTNQNNSPIAGRRTLVYTRPVNTGDANDYTFNFADNTIDLAWARASSASYVMSNHGGGNRGLSLNVPLTTLGIEDFSLNASKVFPNPTNGDFSIQTKTYLNQVNIYTQTGAFVKTIYTENNEEVVNVEVNGLSTSIYLIELINDNQKTWKKVIVN
jgi:hypothetical protein